jgi:nucleoside-diphosphate-sugar epimerase
MRVAILGATSQIAKDLVQLFAERSSHELALYARRPDVVAQRMTRVGLAGRYAVADFAAFGPDEHFDAILNFVGVGDPARAAAMGATIFDVTLKYDELALDYVRQHPDCRYLFLSSGAAYGSSFDEPVDENTKAVVPINNLKPQDWYGVAKLHAECRHRALAHLPIVDIRVFNYFSHTQDMEARFLITDAVRAIRDKTVLKTSRAYMLRDYLHSSDFFRLISTILTSPATNAALDCRSKAPVDKTNLLAALQKKFGLKYELVQADPAMNATGTKPHYYSLNKRAKDFLYHPRLTSLEGIEQELQIFFQGRNLLKDVT